jgi:hypothetical protein
LGFDLGDLVGVVSGEDELGHGGMC